MTSLEGSKIDCEQTEGTTDNHEEDDSTHQVATPLSSSSDSQISSKLLRKIDRNLLPWITLLYLMSYLDRVNIGTAKLVGLTKDLHLTSQEYSNASMMGLVKTYHQLLALRFLLGVFESGLFPGLNFFLTAWYLREELARRASFFYGGAILSGAFGGVLAYGISHMDGVAGKAGWSWIFIIEGLLTLVVAVMSVRLVHDWPDKARFLTESERESVLARLRSHQVISTDDTSHAWTVKRCLSDLKVWLLALNLIVGCVPIYSCALFTPSIVASLGTFKVTESLLLSAPPYVLAALAAFATAVLSDRYRQRAVFLIMWAAIGITGTSILLALPHAHHAAAKYFALFLVVPAAACSVAISMAWSGGIFVHPFKRAISMGVIFTIGNSGGIVASQVYRPKDAPNYRPGHATVLSFFVVSAATAVILRMMFAKINKNRDTKRTTEVDMDTSPCPYGNLSDLGEDHPDYRYLL